MQNHIIKCLDPNQYYTFKAWGSVSIIVKPPKLMDHLPVGSVIISIHDAAGVLAWSTAAGWSEAGYHDAVCSLVSYIDSREPVSAEFTDQALSDGLDVFEAVNSYFEGNTTGFTVNPHLQSLIDVYIRNETAIHRVKLCRFIQAGDIFNVYFDGSSKMGGTWLGDLRLSVAAISEQELEND